MKKTLLAVFMVILGSVTSANAYVVDGNVSDWGVDLTPNAAKNVHYLDTHTPTGSGVSYVTEDNASYVTGTSYVGPGWSTGNTYDAEALYLDNDNLNVYLALVTGMPQFGAQYPPGDIFFDTGKYQDPSSPFYDPKKFMYGINIATSKLYSVSSWQNVVVFSDANPWAIGSGVFLGDVPFVYSGDQKTHHVLEASVPLSLLGLHDGDSLWTHWTMQCGNDVLNLKRDVVVTPEPPSYVLFAVGILLALAAIVNRHKIVSV